MGIRANLADVYNPFRWGVIGRPPTGLTSCSSRDGFPSPCRRTPGSRGRHFRLKVGLKVDGFWGIFSSQNIGLIVLNKIFQLNYFLWMILWKNLSSQISSQVLSEIYFAKFFQAKIFGQILSKIFPVKIFYLIFREIFQIKIFHLIFPKNFQAKIFGLILS